MMFEGYLPESKVWVFISSKGMDEPQTKELKESLQHFVASWEAHGKKLDADFSLQGRLLTVCVNAASEPPSGCSIDKLYTLLHGFESRHRLDFMDRMWLLNQDGLCLHAQKDSSELQKLKGSTIVDLSINQLNMWNTKAYIPVEQSWIGSKIN